MARLIKRGQIWIADLNPGLGVEIHKKRPVLIISADILNQQLPSVIVVPTSSQVHPLGPEKILLGKNEAFLKKESVALAVFVRAIDKSRLIKRVGEVSSDKLIEVEDALQLVLGMVKLD